MTETTSRFSERTLRTIAVVAFISVLAAFAVIVVRFGADVAVGFILGAAAMMMLIIAVTGSRR